MRRLRALSVMGASALGLLLLGQGMAAAQAPLSPIPDLAPSVEETAPPIIEQVPEQPALPGVGTLAPPPASDVVPPALPDPLNAAVDREIDRAQRCWAPPVVVGTEAEGGVARIRLVLNPDGTLAGEPMIIDKPMGPLGTRFAESAAKALKTCAPYRLPPERYADWRLLEVKFDTWNLDAPHPNAPSPARPAP